MRLSSVVVCEIHVLTTEIIAREEQLCLNLAEAMRIRRRPLLQLSVACLLLFLRRTRARASIHREAILREVCNIFRYADSFNCASCVDTPNPHGRGLARYVRLFQRLG